MCRFYSLPFVLILCVAPRALFALAVTDMSPTPGTTLSAPPTSITVTLDQSAATGSANANSVRLVRAGADGVFGTADDVAIVPGGISTNGNLITINLAGVKLPNDQYQVTLVSGPDITSGLVAHWKFDEGSGATALDSSGNGNTGTLNSGASYTNTNLVLPGSAVKFDGVTGAIQVPQSASLEPASAVTVSMWGYITDTMGAGVGELLRKQTKDFGGYILRWNVDDGHIGWFICANTGQYWYSRDPQPNSNYLNAWHHYAATYDSATHLLNLYIDGTLRNSVSGGPAGGLDHTDDLYLMFRNNQTTDPTPGTLDDVRVFNRALSAAEIQALASVPISDSNGNPLDGKFTGAFPSGDGTFQNFVASFTIAAPPLTVTNVSVTPGSTLAIAPSNLVVTFNRNLDAATVNSGSVQLVRAGPDGILGTADDVVVQPAGIATTGNTVTLDLTGVARPNDTYQLTLSNDNGAALSGLVGHWNFSEGSGTIAHDSSGHGHDGTLFNAPAWTAGIGGGALNFSGTNYVEVPYSAELNSSSFTISAWAKPVVLPAGPNSAHSIITSRDDPSPHGYILYAMDSSGPGDWEFWTGNANSGNPWNTLAGTGVAANNWTLLTATYDGTTMRLYQNNSLVSSKVCSYFVNGNRPLRIGAGATESTPTYFFEGLISDVRVYNRALSGAEIAGLHQGVIDSDGNPLDGKFTGAFPSGDGTFQDFTASFTIAASPLTVTALTPAPNALLANSPASVMATFSKTLDPTTASTSSVTITGAGVDGIFGTGDDVVIAPTAINATGNQLTVSLSGVLLLPGQYRLTIKGVGGATLTDTNTNILDGEFTGAFPSGNGTPGGDFVATFRIDSPPVASNSTNTVRTGAALPLALSATDADHDALAYSIVTPPAHGTLSGTLPNVTYTSSAYAGPDSFTFKANDGVTDSNVATVSITVVDQPPLASLTAAPTTLIEGQSVDFNSGASDPDGDALTYAWNFGDGGSSTDANPSHVYSSAGVYTASVTVTDIGGLSVTQSITINVFHDSDRPVARFTSSDLNGFVGQPLGFDATFSTDPLNNIVSYVWNFGDGSPHGTGQLISRVYTATGTYTVSLTITNGQGLTDTTTLTMVILPASQAGLLNANIKYSVSWNRGAVNADTLSLSATVNVGTTPVNTASPLSLGVVGQTFTGTSSTKLSLARAASGPQVKWQIKANTKKGFPKGTYDLKCSIKHASLGQAFALAGVTGVKSSAARIPLRLGIGGSTFESSINSQFRFGSGGAKASGGGQGPK